MRRGKPGQWVSPGEQERGNSGERQGTYTLSGAEALTTREIAAAISAAVGRPLFVVGVPLEKLVQQMVANGLPETAAREIASFDANTAAGGFSNATGDYKAITGREPQSLNDWCTANRDELTRIE